MGDSHHRHSHKRSRSRSRSCSYSRKKPDCLRNGKTSEREDLGSSADKPVDRTNRGRYDVRGSDKDLVDDEASFAIDDGEGFAIDISETTIRRSNRDTDAVFDIPTPKKYSIHKAVVKKVLDFGSFMRIPEYSFDGLLHVSDYIPDLPPPKVNQEFWVKVMNVYRKEDKMKMTLCVKECGQSDGRDLNPKNEDTEGFEKKEGMIELGAITKSVCSRCGMKGHREGECFVDLKKKDLYTLVSDDEEIKQVPNRETRHHHRHHHH